MKVEVEEVIINILLFIESAIKYAEGYFNNEHNRDNECENCINNGCLEEMLTSLKINQYANVICTYYEGAIIEIWNNKIFSEYYI